MRGAGAGIVVLLGLLALAVGTACGDEKGDGVRGMVTEGLPYPGRTPGAATAAASPEGDRWTLASDVLRASWQRRAGRLFRRAVENPVTSGSIDLGEDLFRIDLGDDGTLVSSQARLVECDLADAPVDGDSPRAALACAGRRLRATFEDPEGRIRVAWWAELRDGSNALRVQVEVTALEKPRVVKEIRLFDGRGDGARRIGTVSGSVVVQEGLFCAVEHPLATNDAAHAMVRVGTWMPERVTWPERSVMRWNVTKAVGEPGSYEALFQYTKGGHRLEIYEARLIRDGRVLAKDTHFGATGSVDVDNRYRFELGELAGDAMILLEIDARSDGGTDSTGWVGLARTSEAPRIVGALETETELSPGQTTTLAGVVGAYPVGQLRRAFLHYLERERAHPYRPFLHYNSWYDIGYFSRYDEAACLDVVNTYGRELVEKRGARIDSFLLDDGWDDTSSLWDFHEGLPHGFREVRKAAERYGAGPGVWLSPWGGYGKPRKQRLEAGKKAGYEVTEAGFALSAPKYYERFRDICLEMIKKYGANHFKFDGVRRGGGRYPGSAFGSDFEAAIALIETLRRAKPDLFVNQTTGTWPSPFWLLFADSIWRGGYDHEFTGVGSKRQQWITYRDAKTYENIVRGGPLFPLSSLMLHGVIYARQARGLDEDPENDLQDEIRSAFGCGTQLQELYVTPSLLTEGNWDDLAEAAIWARKHAKTLRDVHWVGGSPAQLEVYGWAAWSPGHGAITLRNPAEKGQTLTIDVGTLLELPPEAATAWRLASPYEDQRVQALDVEAGSGATIELEPFEVLVFDARPR